MIGEQVQHYKIVSRLGGGGMGIVYKARDLKLERDVALKFLPEHLSANRQVKRRFLQEARAASALDHPNICNIHSLEETRDGQMFICMSCYSGQTLKERMDAHTLTVEEVLQISMEIAQGLARGHEAGITHRDIKPANIMITGRNEIKILDYGLAKLSDGPRLTRDGITVGTPAYMSPEQLRREDIDHRTDIWSLGIVMYEMFAGRLPFEGTDELAIACSIAKDDPKPLESTSGTLENGLKRIIEKCLVKNREHRYQTLHKMLTDLSKICPPDVTPGSGITITRPEVSPSIAVLPFKDLSIDQNQAYFCDGLTEELIDALTRVEGLRVASRTSAWQYRQQQEDVREIGKKLNVQTILEGSIRKAGMKLRISAQLTDVNTGFNLWSERFEREFEDIFALQDELSDIIVRTLQDHFTKKLVNRPLARYRPAMDAQQNYLKGRYYWNRRSLRELKKGMRFFKRAIEKDADYAMVYAGLADAYNTLGMYGAYAPEIVMPRAIRAAGRALQLDDHLPEAHISLACANAIYEWNWEEAERKFISGLELNEEQSNGHHWYAINLLVPQGRFDDALTESKMALEVDPVSLPINTALGLQYYFAREFDAAVGQLTEAIDMDPNFAPAHFFLGKTLAEQSQYDEAMHQIEKAIHLHGESTNMLAAFGYTAAMAGMEEPALSILGNLLKPYSDTYVSSYDIAVLCAGLGYRSKALDWLESALAERSYLMIYMNVDPALDSLREEPRFQKLLRRLELT